MRNRTILIFAGHPDDELYGAGGTIALLNRNHNKVYIAIFTNDDKVRQMKSNAKARINVAGKCIGDPPEV